MDLKIKYNEKQYNNTIKNFLERFILSQHEIIDSYNGSKKKEKYILIYGVDSSTYREFKKLKIQFKVFSYVNIFCSFQKVSILLNYLKNNKYKYKIVNIFKKSKDQDILIINPDNKLLNYLDKKDFYFY